MNVQVTSRPTAEPAASSKLAIADGDIHPQRNSYKDLFPYMERRWIEMAKTFGSRPRQAYQAGPAYPKGQPNASRRDAWPPGGRPGSSLPFLQKQLLDENNIQLGILNPTGDNGASFQNREFGAGVASAMNRWVEAEWLIEPRLKGSIVVPYEDSEAAVKEIERWAGDPRFVQVLMVTRTADPPGQKRYWKIYEAAAAAGLPIGVHAFGFGGYPVTGSGWPSFYIEDMVGHAQSAQSFLTSLVIEGVFERIPDFRLVLIEVRLRLAAAAGLAARQAVAPAEGGDAAPEARTVGIHPRAGLADHAADGGAAAPRARARRDRLDRLGPPAVRHRLPALGLRRSDPGAADAAAGTETPRLLLQQRDGTLPAGLTLADQPDLNSDQWSGLQPGAIAGHHGDALLLRQSQAGTVTQRQPELARLRVQGARSYCEVQTQIVKSDRQRRQRSRGQFGRHPVAHQPRDRLGEVDR